MTTEWKPDPVANAVATLIHAAGRRDHPPAEAYGAVLVATEQVWHAKVQRRRRWRIAIGLAAAALIVSLTSALLWPLRSPAPSVGVARVDRVVGEAHARAPGAVSWVPIARQVTELHAGTRVRTSENGVAGLTLAGGVSLRLAAMTEVALDSAAQVRLRHGAVYADTGPGDGGTISVITPAGTAHDFGTQFEIRYEHERLQLRVREGRVALLSDADRVVVDAGTQLAIDDSGDLTRTLIASTDAGWQWAESVAPAPDLDDQAVSVLLKWVARETGRKVRYANAAVERQAMTTILHGKVEQLAPLAALDTLLATTDLACEIREDGTIEVRHK